MIWPFNLITGAPRISAFALGVAAPLTVIVAPSVGAVEVGSTLATIEVALLTLMPETVTALPSGAVAVTLDVGQPDMRKACRVVKPVPVIVTEFDLPAYKRLGDMEAMVGVGQLTICTGNSAGKPVLGHVVLLLVFAWMPALGLTTSAPKAATSTHAVSLGTVDGTVTTA